MAQPPRPRARLQVADGVAQVAPVQQVLLLRALQLAERRRLRVDLRLHLGPRRSTKL